MVPGHLQIEPLFRFSTHGGVHERRRRIPFVDRLCKVSGAERLSRDSCGMQMHFPDKSMTPVLALNAYSMTHRTTQLPGYSTPNRPTVLSISQVAELDGSAPSSSTIVSSASFDTVIGADLVYKEEAFEPLRKTLLELAGPETVVLFASRIRYPKVSYVFYSNPITVISRSYSNQRTLSRTASSTTVSRASSAWRSYPTTRKRTFFSTRCRSCESLPVIHLIISQYECDPRISCDFPPFL